MNDFFDSINDNNVSEFIRNFYRYSKDNALSSLEKEALNLGVPIIKIETRKLLELILMLKQPKRILEIGSGVAYSAIVMAQVTNASILTVESLQQRADLAVKNVAKYNLNDRIFVIHSDAELLITELVHKKEKFDFIFMDGPKGQYIKWLSFLFDLLDVDGILFSDNILQNGKTAYSTYALRPRDRTIHNRLNEYLYVLTNDENLHTSILSVGDGVSITYRKRK